MKYCLMKCSSTTIAVLACAGIAAMSPACAQQAVPRYYAGFHGGVHDIDEWDADVELGAGIQLQGHLDLEGQREGGFIVGREYTHARFELEYQRGDFDISDVRLGAIAQSTTGTGDYKAITANAYWQQHFSESFSAYLGVGIGWGETSLPRINFANGCNCMNTSKESDFVYLVRIGAEYRFADNHNLFIQYSILDLPGPVSATNGVRYDDNEVGIGALGYRYHFK